MHLRGIRLCLIWLCAAAAAPGRDSSDHGSVQTLDGAANELSELSNLYKQQLHKEAQSEQVRPCDKGVDNRNSDLCAQWKAADAASRAAFWAMIGTLVASLGTAGLYWQIVLTRRAIQETGRATSEMVRSNEIGDRTATAAVAAYQAQLASSRPLMQLDVKDSLVRARPLESPYNTTGNGKVDSLTMRYRFKNMGQQPCWIEAAWIGFFVGKFDNGQLTFPSEINDQFRVMVAGFVEPGQSVGDQGGLYRLDAEQLALLSEGGAGVIMYGMCQYRSPSKHLFSTRFAYQIPVGENQAWDGYPVNDPAHWRDGVVKQPKIRISDPIEYTELK